MVDPDNITAYDQSRQALEERLIFWLCVFGKTARFIAPAVERILTDLGRGRAREPFQFIREYAGTDWTRMPPLLKSYGIGCHTVKGKGLWTMAFSGLDLHTCTYEQLKTIPGIGKKTAKCFILHSRRDSEDAGLDTHVLKALRAYGYEDAPLSTPSSDKQYSKWEEIAIRIARREKKTAAQWDLEQWLKYRKAAK